MMDLTGIPYYIADAGHTWIGLKRGTVDVVNSETKAKRVMKVAKKAWEEARKCDSFEDAVMVYNHRLLVEIYRSEEVNEEVNDRKLPQR